MASAVVTGLSGGNLAQMLRLAAIAGVTAFAFNIVGSATNAVAGYDPNWRHITPQFGSEAHLFNIAGHAAVGCVSAAASGGRCQDGVLSSAVGTGAEARRMADG